MRKKITAAFAAMALIVTGLFVASAASAWETDNYIETSHDLYCGGVDITLHNVSPWIYPVSVEIDSVHSYGPVVDNRLDAPDDQTGTRTITFVEDSGTHAVRYRVQAGTESDLYRDLPVGTWTELTVESDCAPPVVVEPPVVTPPVVTPPVVTPPAATPATPKSVAPSFTG